MSAPAAPTAPDTPTTAASRVVDAPLRLASEAALWLVTVAAVVGMHRLFEDGSYRGALVLQAVVAHLTVALLRRAGVRLLPAAAATLALGVLFITWTRFPETVSWALPTGDTVRALGDDLGTAWSLFGDVSAPAPVENGFVVTTAAAVWIIAYLADWAAFRVGAPFEAVLPATVLFLFAAALGGESSPFASALLFATCALGFVLLHRTAAQMRSSRWSAVQRRQVRWSLVATGSTIIGVAVVAVALALPHLPGADAEAVIDWQNLGEDEPTRYVQSPLVSIQTKLIEQSEVELFTVRSERSAYWRTTALDDFDGTTWKSSYSTDEADGVLPRMESDVESWKVTQDITIEALSSVWLPAAFEPEALDAGPEQQVVYDERSSTLMVDRDVPTSDGYEYTVTSAFPDWSSDQLRTASTEIPTDIVDRYLKLPDGFPRTVGTEAFRIAGDQSTPYDKARALQDYLRSDLFAYDVEVGLGDGNDALSTFLFQTRRGYCQQFAGAFAAMARALDLPARVAVGFTPGVQDPNDPTLFRVRGVHAHAWPEVYLGEYGWVPFEPTPGRGPPRGTNWLGVDEQQDTSTGGAAVTDPVGDGLGDGLGSDAIPSGDDLRQPTGGLGAELAGGGSDVDQADEPSRLVQAVEDGAPAAGIGLAAYLLLVPLALALQQLVRHRRARTPRAKIELGWTESAASFCEMGASLPAWMTVSEKADRMAEALPGAAGEVRLLAAYTERAAYAPVPPDEAEAEEAARAHAAVEAELRRKRTWPQRLGRHLDIRRLLSGGRRTRIVTGEVVHGEVVPPNASPGVTAV